MNCLKRAVYCVILKDGTPVAFGRNSCSPENSVCVRMSRANTKENYDDSGCNSVHAEINAIGNIPSNLTGPFTAIVLGHDYACDPCEIALSKAGVTEIVVKNP